MSAPRAELSRRILERTLRGVSTHALVLLDPDGVIVGWLLGSERFFGYTADEAVGQNVSIIFTPEDLQKGRVGG